MPIESPNPPAEVVDAFVATAHRIVWCSAATVDRRGRPRCRVLHPYWERTDDGLVGWVVTRPTPLKVAHLARTPYLTCSYWDATHDVAIADCHAEWVDDSAIQEHVWRLFASAPEPLGYDFRTVWPDGPACTEAALLCLRPWRLHVADVETLAQRNPPLAWREEPPARKLATGRYLVHHRHEPHECPAAFAAWRGFASPLRGAATTGSCRFGGHELWWRIDAESEADALAFLPEYVAQRATATRVEEVQIP
jgi:hypothetical protein